MPWPKVIRLLLPLVLNTCSPLASLQHRMFVDDAFLLHVSLFEVMNKTEVDVLATIRMTKEQNALVEDLIAWVGARLVGAQVRW